MQKVYAVRSIQVRGRSTAPDCCTSVSSELVSQLAVTVAGDAVCQPVAPLQSIKMVLNRGAILLVARFSTLTWILLVADRKNHYPDTMRILTGSAITEAWVLGTVSAICHHEGSGELILLAWAITLFIVATLRPRRFLKGR